LPPVYEKEQVRCAREMSLEIRIKEQERDTIGRYSLGFTGTQPPILKRPKVLKGALVA
jgi:hypothetical protein